MIDLNFKNYGYVELLTCIALNGVGLIFINSGITSSYTSFISQLMISFASIIICIFISILNLKKLMDRYYIFWWICIFSLIIVRILGTAYGRNSTRWITIPVVNMSIQPSDFAKLFLILFISKYLEQFDTKAMDDVKNLLKIVFFFFVPFFLIFSQPNLSSSLIFFFIFVSIMFVSRIKLKWFYIFGGLVLTMIITLNILIRNGAIYNLPLLKPYQIDRIVSFFSPTEDDQGTYQQENSVIAIGSGKLTGKGVNNNSTQSVKNGNWLAEAQNDFIFAVVGEEVGFFGSTLIILAYIFLIISCLFIAGQQREYYKKLICVGVASWLGIQSFINLAVATSLIPNTGIPLPFFSQGGSALLSIYMGMGFVLNIKREIKV